MSKIIAWQTRAPTQALQALNRRTGLDFDHWPESLLRPTTSECHSARPANNHAATMDLVSGETRKVL